MAIDCMAIDCMAIDFERGCMAIDFERGWPSTAWPSTSSADAWQLFGNSELLKTPPPFYQIAILARFTTKTTKHTSA